MRRATLSDLVNEKASGISMDTLLRMQAWHDGWTMRQHADEIAVARYERKGRERLVRTLVCRAGMYVAGAFRDALIDADRRFPQRP